MDLRVLAKNLREKRSNPIDCVIHVCVLYGRPADVEILCKSVLMHISFLHSAFLPLFGAWETCGRYRRLAQLREVMSWKHRLKEGTHLTKFQHRT